MQDWGDITLTLPEHSLIGDPTGSRTLQDQYTFSCFIESKILKT